MKLNLKNKVVVLTGAASGIGAALAQQLATQGCHLALIDRDAARLSAMWHSLELQFPDLRITHHILDLSQRADIKQCAHAILTAHEYVDILINNAGIALIGDFVDCSETEFDAVLTVNLMAVIDVMRCFLPVLQSRPQAHIVNLSSVFGLIAPAGQVAYATSKFAVRGFSESLRHELIGSNVTLTVVHPGGIRTDIARNAIAAQAAPAKLVTQSHRQFNALAITSAESAAQRIIQAVIHRAPRLIIGKDAKLINLIQKLFSVHYWRLMQRLLPTKK